MADQIAFIQVVGPAHVFCAADGCDRFMVNADIWCIEHLHSEPRPTIRNGWTAQYMWHLKKQCADENKRLGWDTTGPIPVKVPSAAVDVIQRASLQQPVADCTWTEDSDGNWDTHCGNKWVLNVGTPSENGMKFCPLCGFSLTEVRYADDYAGVV